MGLSRRADPLRNIADRMKLPEFRRLTSIPTIHEAVRVTIHYDQQRKPDSVATLVRGHHIDHCKLTVLYDRPMGIATLEYEIAMTRYQTLLGALRRARFDYVDDEPDLPFLGVDLWLIERAAGSFYHDIVLGPASASGNYREFVLAFQQHLPESVRTGT